MYGQIMIKCYRCEIEKPEDEFSWKKLNIKRSGVCKPCHKAYRHQHYLDNQQKYLDKARAWEIKAGGKRAIKYGVSNDLFEGMVSRYNGNCWVCKKKPATHVDHDHKCCASKDLTCGKCVRGILCQTCNTGIGMLGDNLEGLQNAVNYLNEYATVV